MEVTFEDSLNLMDKISSLDHDPSVMELISYTKSLMESLKSSFTKLMLNQAVLNYTRRENKLFQKAIDLIDTITDWSNYLDLENIRLGMVEEINNSLLNVKLAPLDYSISTH